MNIESMNTTCAPAAIGPYSQAIKAGNLLFCSGQIPLDPKTGEVVVGSIEDETRRVLDNLMEVVKAGGSSPAKIIKTTIYVKDMNQFGKINEIYGSYFKEPYPARATVEVSALPKGVHVEIDAIAAL